MRSDYFFWLQTGSGSIFVWSQKFDFSKNNWTRKKWHTCKKLGDRYSLSDSIGKHALLFFFMAVLSKISIFLMFYNYFSSEEFINFRATSFITAINIQSFPSNYCLISSNFWVHLIILFINISIFINIYNFYDLSNIFVVIIYINNLPKKSTDCVKITYLKTPT